MSAIGREVTAEAANLVVANASHAAALVGAAATVILFYLAFPGGPAPWLGWIAMVPLGVALRQLAPRQAFFLTFSCAFFGWLVATWWVVPGLSLATRSPMTVAVPFELLFCVVYALPYAIAGWLSVRLGWMGSTGGAFKAAIAWTAISNSIPHLLPGNLAHTQYSYPLMIQLVDLGGLPLLLFVLHWFSWLLVAAWVQRRQRSGNWYLPLVLAGLILAVVAAYGSWRLAEIDQLQDDPATPRLTVGMIQPNLPVTGRERADWLTAVPRLEAMTRHLLEQAPDTGLVVWPEIPTPFSYTDDSQDREYIDRLVRETGRPLLLTDFLGDQSGPGGRGSSGYFNAMELVDVAGNSQIYRKQHLLPFGEYLPGEENFPLLRSIFPSALRYIPGERSVVYEFSPGITLVPLICYEAVFPELTRSAVRRGGNLLINTVNDAWFQGSNGPQIHFALALFRTVEFRVPLARVTNSGMSAVIDAGGRIMRHSLLPQGRHTAMAQTVIIPNITSVYSRMGNWALRLAWGLSMVILVSDFAAKKYKIKGSPRLSISPGQDKQ